LLFTCKNICVSARYGGQYLRCHNILMLLNYLLTSVAEVVLHQIIVFIFQHIRFWRNFVYESVPKFNEIIFMPHTYFSYIEPFMKNKFFIHGCSIFPLPFHRYIYYLLSRTLCALKLLYKFITLLNYEQCKLHKKLGVI
jgi:hypothetical protein